MTDNLKINLSYLHVVNFAMQQNGVQVIREISIKNKGKEVIKDLNVNLTFDPEFASPWTCHINKIVPGAEERITLVNVVISTDFLTNLTERIDGSILLSVTSGEETIAENRYDISVLTYNQWAGCTVMPVMLAAFCTPNNPALAPLIRRASEILGNWTGDSSLSAYQSHNPNRVKAQMAALYEAIKEKSISYCVSSADFEDRGQRIRTVDEIMDNRIANCIEFTMLYASCLEAIGLNPLVILNSGHAYVGCWLIQSSFADNVNDDPSLINKRLADGINDILVLESTCMKDGSTVKFDDAVKLGIDKLNAENFCMFIDIDRARTTKIRPLPLRVMSEDGRYKPAVDDIASHGRAPEEIGEKNLITDLRTNVGKKTIWERRLLDLTLNNTLLNLQRRQGTIPFVGLDISLLEDELTANKEFTIHPKPTDWEDKLMNPDIFKEINATDPIREEIRQEQKKGRLHSYLTKENLAKSLTNMYRVSRTALEENGANTLYLALGLLKWYETENSEIPKYAPVLLVPVELTRKSASSGYTLKSRDEEVLMNITLLEYLRQTFDINICGLDPLPKDESGINTQAILNTVRSSIMELKNWDIVEEAVLGNFSFNKFIMWNDIHSHGDILDKSPIVRSLMNSIVDEELNAEIGVSGNLDETIKAGDIILPISADSSQIEAITAAMSGKSFVLHGPPGTGKSQTITNIIANALYTGKKVLFVAEKMAALEVVQNRLNSIGLGPFCLEIHSNKAKKSNVMEQLKKATEVTKTTSPEEYKHTAQELNAVRDQMNAVVNALHKEYPVGWSLYDCIANYVRYSDECKCFNLSHSKAKAATPETLREMNTALYYLKAALKPIGKPSEFSLYGINCTDFNAIHEVLERLPETISEITALKEKVSDLRTHMPSCGAEQLTKHIYDFLINIAYITDTSDVDYDILHESETSVSDIENIIEHGKLRDGLKNRLSLLGNDILEIDARAYEAEWREILSKGFFGRMMAVGKFIRKLATYTKTKINENEILPILKDIDAYQKENHIVTECAGKNAYLKAHISGYETDWDKIESTCRFARHISGVAAEYKIEGFNSELATVLSKEGNHKFLEIIALKDKVNEMVSAAFQSMGSLYIPESTFILDASETLTRWSAGKDKIRNWINYIIYKEKVQALGFNELVEMVDNGSIEAHELVDTFYKTLYKTYADYILTQEPDLRSFAGYMFEEQVKLFRGWCRNFEDLTKEELFAKVASTLPSFPKEASEKSEVGILKRNISNNCRRMSLRTLFANVSDLLQRICPCMLMSPISVAQYLDPDSMKFDLVIFDEASQMPTCEAVGAIARGKSIVIVGDPMQLPPTNFFNASNHDEENSSIEDLDSVLEDCTMLCLPEKHLLWHYRSKHESLIAFSNSRYYENSLQTFPSPDDIETKVRYQYVKGVYERGSNRHNKAEAEAIIKEIRHRLEDPVLSQMSIGVVTFNSNQQSLLEDMLNDMFVKHPKLEKVAQESAEPIFIKNLENVQGDERDVILFSVGFGQDKEGKISMNFGPLNQSNGWKRLNVAVSRARYEMKVFSSLRSDQIDTQRSDSRGVADLKEFLAYAEKGIVAAYNTSSLAPSDDGLVENVAKALNEKGYAVKTNIGTSGYKIDIAVKDPSNEGLYLMGILCDGYNYHASRSARDREIIQVDVLRKLGWKIQRVWALDWWTNREMIIDELVTKIEAAIAGEYKEEEDSAMLPQFARSRNSTASRSSDNQDQLADLKTDTDGDLTDSESDVVIPYAITALQQYQLDLDAVANGYFNPLIKEYIKQVIETEAPITKDLLCRRVMKSLNLTFQGNRMTALMNGILDDLDLKRTESAMHGNVYWKDDQDPETYKIFRSSRERESMHIPAEEARNAAVYILDQQGAQPGSSLIREMCKAFGYSRLGPNVEVAMLNGIELAAAQSLIDKSNPERITLTD